MDEEFKPIAQSRANYFTQDSPVQFVRVELLQGVETKTNAVCLTFKNIDPEQTLHSLKVHFKCKGKDGTVICEDDFDYEDINEEPGSLFGMYDAVVETAEAIGTVDVLLLNCRYGSKTVSLESCRRVRLPALKRLQKQDSEELCIKMKRNGMKYLPEDNDYGWYCACGAFHPAMENTVFCSECGCDKILLEQAMDAIYRERKGAEEAEQLGASKPDNRGAVEEPTRIASAESKEAPKEEGSTRKMDLQGRKYPELEALKEQRDRMEQKERDAEEDEEEAVWPDTVIRWAPPVTAILCALIAIAGFAFVKLFL